MSQTLKLKLTSSDLDLTFISRFTFSVLSYPIPYPTSSDLCEGTASLFSSEDAWTVLSGRVIGVAAVLQVTY
jgi:hypothetical protein